MNSSYPLGAASARLTMVNTFLHREHRIFLGLSPIVFSGMLYPVEHWGHLMIMIEYPLSRSRFLKKRIRSITVLFHFALDEQRGQGPSGLFSVRAWSTIQPVNAHKKREWRKHGLLAPVALVAMVLGAIAGISSTLVVVSEEEESPDGWQKSDSNADGEVDEWINFKDGVFLKWERDHNFDGRRDDWSEFEDGVPVRSRKDTNFDGKPDEWIQFDEMGLAGEIKNDLNFDGKVDEWTIFVMGVQVGSRSDKNFDQKVDEWVKYGKYGYKNRIDNDTNFDTKIDEWVYCGEFGQTERIESDLNFDDSVDAWEFFELGHFTNGRYDLDYDGRPDSWSFGKFGQIVEQHWSLDGSGKPNKKAYYVHGVKIREEFDLDQDDVFEVVKKFDKLEREID